MSAQDSPASEVTLANVDTDSVKPLASDDFHQPTGTIEAQQPAPAVVVEAEEPLSPKSPKSPRSPKPKFIGFKRFKQLARLKNSKDALIVHPLASPPATPTSEKASLYARSDDIPDGDNEDDDDPIYLAQKIRQLIKSLPAVNHPPPKPPLSPSPPSYDSGCPTPPPSAIHVQDKHLVELLSSATVMNGRKEEWPTVWSILESLAAPSNGQEGLGKDSGSSGDSDKGGTATNQSVMFYLPLEPEADDQVELAKSELVPALAAPLSPGNAAVNIHGWKWWPFPGKKGQNPEPTTPSTPSTPAPHAVKKVWLPSTTKVSVEVTYWGYRIFLPPPVMAVLGNQEIQAAKRAAMVSTALTWLFAHLPVTMFPAPLQPMILVLQKIVPYISYIGTFISWSWGEIKSYDIGYGVILNATWLLPVALLPTTWKAESFPSATPIKEHTAGLSPLATTPIVNVPIPPTLPATTQLVQTSSADTQEQTSAPPPPPEVELVDLSKEPVTTDADTKEVPIPEAPLSPSLATKFVEALDENNKVLASFAAIAAARTPSPMPVASLDPVAEVVSEVTTEPTSAEGATTADAPAAAAKSEAQGESVGEAKGQEEMPERPSSPIAAVWKYFTG
ncbi:hypothetical protein GYMLUDRAFT_242676 [Collybiopsis luxurians FD-317 M1]|uniref:Uncharacterized protein n=1 Tax=Collybiopsis luxurians FD-317 M1 TaxID=944289 RepID=A0A0D0BFD2_9AGAR|nr:hypothetical protein GYMLUDRAFT_242676 [Collybiopsis luxurians FD-317 M1]